MFTQRSLRRILALIAIVAMIAAGCGGDDDDDGGDTASGDGSASGEGGECTEPDQVEIGFPGLPPDFVQMGTPLADHRGVFEEYCIDAEFIGVESGISAFRAMAAGEFQFSYSGSISPVLARAEFQDAVVFMSPANLLDFQVSALPEFESCEALEGQPIATDGPGGLNHAIMEEYLARVCDLDIDTDVRVQIGDPETFGAQLASGTVKAAALHVDERLFVADEIGIDLQVLGNAWEYAPDFHYASLSTARNVLEENRDLYVRISAAILESNAWLVDPANEEEAIDVIAEVSEQPVEVVQEAYDTFGANFPDTCEEALNLDAYQYLIDLQVELGNLEESYEAAELVDTSVCEDAAALVEESN